MSSDSNGELLSAILIGVSLLLLLCWLNKNKDGMHDKNLPGLKFSDREGYQNVNQPGLKLRSSFVPSMYPSGGYAKHSVLEGFDNMPVQSMHDLNTTMTPRQIKAKKTLDNSLALRRPDNSIQIDHLASTECDLALGNGQFGHELIDPSLCREKQERKKRGSLSVDVMDLTDIGDRDQLYGVDRSDLTMS